ncbi:MAG: Ig domain-containing protein [Raoultibacter sp.]|jgi:hypothetical protein
MGIIFAAGITNKAYADEPNTNTTLYFGDGDKGISLYTNSALSNKYAIGEGDTWSVSGNTLTLNNFEYELCETSTTGGTQYGLVMTIDSNLVLEGTNSISLTRKTDNTYGIFADDNLTISGEGSLAIDIAHTRNESWGIYLNKADTLLTIKEATVDVTLDAKPADAVDERTVRFGGLYAASGASVHITDGASVVFNAPDKATPTSTAYSYGMYFQNTETVNPLVIAGNGVSLTATGCANAIKAGATTPVEPGSYGVYANDNIDGKSGNSDWGNWVSTHGAYYVGARVPNPFGGAVARYVEFAEKPRLATTALDNAVIEQPYSFQMQASGPASDEFQWSCDTKNATGPAKCLSIDRSTGIISGTPTELGTGTITVYVSNRFGSASKTFDFAVYPRAEIHADAALNSVSKGSNVSGTGTTNDPFTVPVNTDFSLNVTADRSGEIPVVPGDTQYVAIDWNMDASGTFAAPPYVIDCKLTEAKAYTLTVNFQEQVWDGSAWVATGNIDTKTWSVQATAQPKPGPTPNPDPNPDANKGQGDSYLAKSGDCETRAWTAGLLLIAVFSVLALFYARRQGFFGRDGA